MTTTGAVAVAPTAGDAGAGGVSVDLLDLSAYPVGRRLAARRVALGLNQGAVAAAAGIPQTYVSLVERGSGAPERIAQVAAALRRLERAGTH